VESAKELKRLEAARAVVLGSVSAALPFLIFRSNYKFVHLSGQVTVQRFNFQQPPVKERSTTIAFHENQNAEGH
jgi:hypothetical protein